MALARPSTPLRGGRPTRSPVNVVAAAVAIYGLGPVIVAGVASSGPAFAVWRLWSGVAVLAIPALISARRGGIRLAALRWPLLGGLCFGGSIVFLFAALQETTVATVVLIDNLAPVLVGVAAVPLYGERPGPGFIGWAALGLAGGVVIGLGEPGGVAANPEGIALAVGATVTFTGFLLVGKSSGQAIALLPYMALTQLVAALLATGVAVAVAAPVLEPSGIELAAAFAVAAIPGGLGHLGMTYGMRRLPANVPPLIRLAEPVLAAALAWVILSQAVSALTVVGGVAVLAGAAGAVSARGRTAP